MERVIGFRLGSSRRSAVLATALVVALLSGGQPVGAAVSPSGAYGSTSVSLERLEAASSIDVALAVSRRMFPFGHAPIVFLAASATQPGAVAIGPVAAHLGGAILYASPASLPDRVGQELVRLAPGRVEVIGDSSAVDQDVLDQVQLLLPEAQVERVGGSDAASTAAALSALAFGRQDAQKVFVAIDGDPSAVIGGNVATSLGDPLLIVAKSSLPAATATELERLEPDQVVIVGSNNVVADSVQLAIDGLFPGTTRLSGTDVDRLAVAAQSAYFPSATTTVAIAAGDVAAGLVAEPLAISRLAPVIFVSTDDLIAAPIRDRIIAAPPARFVTVGKLSDLARAQLVGFADHRLTAPPATPAYPIYDSGYHDPGEMLLLLRATELAYPSLVHVFSIGKSYEGRDIWAAKVSANVGVDENEPGVLVDTLHHADEHFGVEQALYLLWTLTSGYASDPYVRRLVGSRAVYIVFAMNPDGWAYDLSGGRYHFWRKNRQPSGGYIGTDINRNYGYQWGCCGGSSSSPSAWNFRGSAPWSTPEAKALRDFVASRVVNGVQQIRTHVTLHTNGELILYPDGWSRSPSPPDIPADDRAAFVAMAKRMASLDGYKPEPSSSLYVTDGDEIDWLYHQYRIFSFTMELYPKDQPSLTAMVYPPYSIVPAQTARNRAALLYLIDAAGCPWASIGKAAQYCSSAPVVTPDPSSSILMP